MTRYTVIRFEEGLMPDAAHLFSVTPTPAMLAQSWAFAAPNGRVHAVAGIASPWPGMGEAWLALDIEAARSRPQLALAIRDTLREVTRGYYRVHAAIRADSTTSWRFARWCGFTEEALLDGYFAVEVDAVIMRYRGK